MTTVDVLLSGGRLALAAVFVLAGVAKLRDRDGTLVAVRDFEAPAALAGPLALALPLVELTVAGLLLPTATAAVGAAGALALLALFSAAIAVNLARGRAPECHCFGQLHSKPAGPATLARNAALGAVAAATLAGGIAEPGTGTFHWTTGLSGAEAVAVGLGMTLAGVLVAFLRTLRLYGTALVRVEQLEAALGEAGFELDGPAQAGLDMGVPAPSFALAEPVTPGSTVTLDDLLAPGLPLLLVFASPGCGPCETLMPDLASWQTTHRDRLRVAVLGQGEPDGLRDDARRHGIDTVLVDTDGELYRAYEAGGTPSGVLVAPDATIASPVASGPGAIAELVAGVLDEPGLPIGAQAPTLDHLPVLDGGVPSSAGAGASLLLFWNPDCGFCRSMHPDLLAWQAEHTGSSPQLIVISSGSEERTRAEGFVCPVLLDPDWSASSAFGASGTPSAVVLDADGRIDSEILVGAEAIMRRARGPQLVHVGGQA